MRTWFYAKVGSTKIARLHGHPEHGSEATHHQEDARRRWYVRLRSSKACSRTYPKEPLSFKSELRSGKCVGMPNLFRKLRLITDTLEANHRNRALFVEIGASSPSLAVGLPQDFKQKCYDLCHPHEIDQIGPSYHE